MYDSSKRRKITNEHFPYIGVEIEKPKTLPVKIGNDCWIGKNVSILKGTDVGNEVVIGTGAVVSNQKIPMKTIVVPPKAIILK
jgi:acetyltransferase-like isoleucine patch superfamily enzyme